MLKIKFLSALMAFLMVFGTLAALSTLPVFAADDKADSETDSGEVSETIDYLTHNFESKEAKLATMQLKLERYGYQLYYEPYTGEVAVLNTKTGDILMTNPYDVGTENASVNIKNQLLSQIIIKYSNTEGNELQMFSFVEAASRGQIKVKNIKNGIRVEYVMGQQESRLLVPQMIEKTRFEEQILSYITVTSKYKKLNAFYVLKDPNDPTLTKKMVEEMIKSIPITEKMAVYIFDAKASDRERTQCEQIIKEFCPHYTYEELEADHLLVEYENKNKNPVQFRLALEYYLDESGLSVRLPANGIRFDQNLYRLEYIRILPYIGAGSSEFTGYAMIPDGSGTLIRYEDILKTGSGRILSGKLYGHDYAYHEISGANQQVMRLPIFGIVEDTEYPIWGEAPETTVPGVVNPPVDSDELEDDEESESESESETTAAADSSTAEEEETLVQIGTIKRKTGYVAIIEEGDALASITADMGGNISHKYNSVYTEFNPRPKDSYNLASSISVAGNATWTVVSERKYTGSYRIRFIMLSDLDYAAKNGIDAAGCFDASYVGMAFAYRNELIRSGKMQQLTTDKTQIPLYLETLGVMDVQDKVLSIPVTVKKALTTFDDIKTMTEELGEAGITNLVYKLTGYINGGMIGTLPNRIDVEKAAGNDSGFKDLLSYADEKDIGVYLDVDFSYAKVDEFFDGFSKKSDAVRTIDDRYTQKRTYSAALQHFTSTGMLAISPSVFADIFEELESDLNELGLKSISLGTIGSDVNSDFDEDDPYNREDSKAQIVEILAKVREAGYSIMMDGGNGYALPYADHVLNVTLDSSNFTYASEAIPLFGLVFHGYLNFAGQATNTVGDMRYETLKILENGANPYFIMVYRNSEKLKEDTVLSQYFSISYENWKDDMIAAYNALNDALKHVITSPIKNHGFVIGERVPDADEIEADQKAEQERLEEESRREEESRLEEERKENLESHLQSKEDATAEPTETVTDTESVSESETETDSESVSEEEPEDPALPEEEEYVYTKYTSDNGMIVKVTFENGYAFILNYNIFDVTVKETGNTVISALGYLVLDPQGNVIINSGEEAAA